RILLLSLIGAAGVLLAGVAVALPPAIRRAETYGWDAGAGNRSQPASLRDRINQPFQAFAERSGRQRRLNGGLTLAEHLARADIKLRSSELVMIQLAYLLPMRFVKFRQRRRLKTFNGRLPDMVGLLANALKAGLSLPQAIEAVARNSTPPISDELTRALREMSLGSSTPQALVNMVRR